MTRQFNRQIIEAGVPQGSRLGPMLWNIAYDQIMRMETLPGCRIIEYTDDTLILVSGTTSVEAAKMARRQTCAVVRVIRGLGLQVATSKTECMLFHKPRKKPNFELKLQIGRFGTHTRANEIFGGNTRQQVNLQRSF